MPNSTTAVALVDDREILGLARLEQLGDARQAAGDVAGLGRFARDAGEHVAGLDQRPVLDRQDRVDRHEIARFEPVAEQQNLACLVAQGEANWLKSGGHRPLLVSVDVYRPAAREQLKVVAQALKAHIYEGEVGEANTATVERLAKEARREAINAGCDVLIVDTAGRLHIDDQLMDEMQSLKRLLNPQEILFVADAMTGQDAVRSAEEFHKKLSLTGVVLTKMDGDARGGAALSIRQVTGQPIKFIGVGEKYDALEPFHPDRIVSRILGMADIMSLIEKAEQQIDKKKAQEMASRALAGDGFSLEDFRDQLRQVKKMGSIQNLMGMLPSIGPFAGLRKRRIKSIRNRSTVSRPSSTP